MIDYRNRSLIKRMLLSLSIEYQECQNTLGKVNKKINKNTEIRKHKRTSNSLMTGIV
ncbi:MAG: hypothetical protein V5786_08405 [Psychromonas sp.]